MIFDPTILNTAICTGATAVNKWAKCLPLSAPFLAFCLEFSYEVYRVPQAGGPGDHCSLLRPGAGAVWPVCGCQTGVMAARTVTILR